jgi:hypothetical protein
MKRSEMIDIIKKQWNESTSFPSDTAVAEYILKAIEKAGMLPPAVHSELFGFEPDYKWEEE